MEEYNTQFNWDEYWDNFFKTTKNLRVSQLNDLFEEYEKIYAYNESERMYFLRLQGLPHIEASMMSGLGAMGPRPRPSFEEWFNNNYYFKIYGCDICHTAIDGCLSHCYEHNFDMCIDCLKSHDSIQPPRRLHPCFEKHIGTTVSSSPLYQRRYY